MSSCYLPTDPIDLTKEDDALQKALALSYQDTHLKQMVGGGPGGVSLEDQELSRALEANLAENQTALAHLGLPLFSVFIDPLNPYERRRVGGTPVGLKNVGNTCWFSAVVQSLFHIPNFRDIILNFFPPPPSNGIAEVRLGFQLVIPVKSLPNSQVQQCVQFVLGLQRLFALLMHSERKYIDPLPAIQVGREGGGLAFDTSDRSNTLISADLA